MKPSILRVAALSLLATAGSGLEFVVSGGQIFTPGLAVVDAPQPGTPLGGETLHVALDVTANGRLPLPPLPDDNPTRIWNITVFLYSYATGRNFTVVNSQAVGGNLSRVPVMEQEPGSTVKHINWLWPDCLVGDGQPRTTDSDRGVYNISIRQNYRLNNEDHYTIFDLPISVTNRIESMSGRPSCDALDNPMMTPEEINAPAANSVGILFAPGDSTVVQTADPRTGLGDGRPQAGPGDGLGSAGSSVWREGVRWLGVSLLAVAVLL